MIPVIVGVGQVANKDPDRIVHPIELIEEAVRRAEADARTSLAGTTVRLTTEGDCHGLR